MLAVTYKKNRPQKPASPEPDRDQLPLQVIQLPVYNEDTVMVKALIDSVCDLNYPLDKLIIQLLDDSDLPELSSALQEYIHTKTTQSKDLQLFYLHRENRLGYKAGNLNYGLDQLKTILTKENSWDPDRIIVSIFDADYLVPSDYLNRTVHYFRNPDIGIVQTRTTFRNKQLNPLTRAQAIFQDNLHTLELSARSQTNHLSMFRGSAGSLRLTTIIDSGYWQGDTQIEDVDLSFASQCKGWKIIYADHIVSTSLLPKSYNEFKLQQRSWMKGLMEVMRKRIGPIIVSNKLSALQKVLGIDFFLVLSLQALFMIISHLTIIPAYFFWCFISSPQTFNRVLLLLLALLALTHIPFFVRKTKNAGRGEKVAKADTPGFKPLQPLYSFYLMTAMFPTFSYGLLEGLAGVKVHRERTGKGDAHREVQAPQALPRSSIDVLKKINRFEILLALYSVGMIIWAFWQEEYIIFTVYSTLAIMYPLNAVISYCMLRPVSEKSAGLAQMK
jgi:cellulose synthase/poly-beta-1,6-N-acetylglucosamine synthase-like glycosyltransferase